jgi:DNA polymerase-3 subunit epsilon
VLDFTAIDFETANEHWGSPCAVGLVRVRDGVAVQAVHWLMRPPSRVDYFTPRNIEIHKITPEMVAAAPPWRELLPKLVGFVGDDVAVAHNARFDASVIRYACANDQLPAPRIPFLCTLNLSRRALSLPNYRLPTVVRGLGLELFDHHNPLADAQAVVGIVGALAARSHCVDVSSLAASLDVRIDSGYESLAGNDRWR